MVTLSESWLTTARPRLPLPVKSPAATADGEFPTTFATGSWKVPSPLPRQDGDVAGADVSRGQVEAAVSVEIARDQCDRARPHRRVHCGLERAVAVAQQHRDIVGVGVGDSQVEMTVAEVARHDRGWVLPPTAIDLATETCRRRCLAGYQRACVRVGHGQVEVTGAEVAGHDGRRSGACGELDGLQGGEIAPALIGQDGDVPGT